jgi:hypothetical protein
MDFLSASRVGARWWRNNGNGTFSSNTIGGLEGAWAVVGADVEGDGDIDVAAASPHPDAQQMRFWKNNGGWQTPKILPLLEAEDLCAADLDGDGVMEILGVSWAEDLADPGNDLVYYKDYLNGSGTAVMVDPDLSGAHSVIAADFDKDGDNDIVASGDGRIKVYRNLGGAIFSTPKEISKNGALCVNVYDIDGDGDLDFTAQGRNPPNQNVYWWERTSDLNFVQHLVGTNIGECWAVHAGDLDNDGDMDITAASQTFRTIRAYINNGSQQFSELTVVDNFGTTNGARYAIPMDVDGDGDADIIGAAPGAGIISWFETISTPGGGSQEPAIASFSPGSGPVGTEVTINGTNFTGTTQVAFNASSAVFSVDSNTRIRATVPAGATTGRIRVVTLAGTALSATDYTVTSGGGSGTSVTFTPIHDAYTKSSMPTSSYGASSLLRVRKSSTDNMNSYLKFDVTGIVAVQRATLRLYVTDDGNDAGKLYLVSNTFKGTSTPWKQSTLNWNNAPEITGTALSAVGSVTVGNWIEFDVTSAMRSNGVYSFALTNASSNTVGFSSREGANRPQLVIEGTVNALAAGDDNFFDAENSRPGQFSLAQNYPNPFNPETQIVFEMPADESVQLTVYDILGRQVAVLVNATLQAGKHQITWDGRNADGLRVSTGMYFYQLRTPNFVASRRMLLVQ